MCTVCVCVCFKLAGYRVRSIDVDGFTAIAFNCDAILIVVVHINSNAELNIAK